MWSAGWGRAEGHAEAAGSGASDSAGGTLPSASAGR